MLKSPVMINSWGVVAAEERKELKSSRKRENGTLIFVLLSTNLADPHSGHF